jgi:hypothetical protein
MNVNSAAGQASQAKIDTHDYTKRKEAFQLQADVLATVISKHSLMRVAVALLVLVAGYGAFINPLYALALPCLLVLFLWLVKRQSRKESERSLLLHLVNLNAWEAEALQGRFSNFPSGDVFKNTTHAFTYDLDIFGNGSLFQYLNRCATHLGEINLASGLAHLSFTKHEIQARQVAIKEVAPLIEFRQTCWAMGRQINDSKVTLDPLLHWLTQPDLFYGKPLFTTLKWGLPIITCLCLPAMYFNSLFQSVFVLMMVAQLALAARYNKPISVLQTNLSSYKAILENYASLMALMKKQTFTSQWLKSHRQKATEAQQSVQKFARLVNALESRLNFFGRVLGNGLFLVDFHTVSNLEHWRRTNAAALPGWLTSLAEWDALLSFATLHFNQPHFAFAEIGEQLWIEADGVGHPLLPASARVSNPLHLGNPASIMLVTGANMAGKSTYLRAVGINYILAANASPVCANIWRGPLLALRTGMRTSDSLQENQSYFFAELNRLQSIMLELRKGQPMLVLLDEILKGTNSTDKQLGSRELLKQLLPQPVLVIVATHDIALGDMEQEYPEKVFNACFEGYIHNDQLTFNYKLNQGVATKANATFLMRKMGIIPASGGSPTEPMSASLNTTDLTK